jgi:hypothetical protein
MLCTVTVKSHRRSRLQCRQRIPCCVWCTNKRKATSASLQQRHIIESLLGDLWCNGQREPCCSTWCLCFSIRPQPRTSRGEAFLPSFSDCLPPRKQKATMKRKQTPYVASTRTPAVSMLLIKKNAVFLAISVFKEHI